LIGQGVVRGGERTGIDPVVRNWGKERELVGKKGGLERKEMGKHSQEVKRNAI